MSSVEIRGVTKTFASTTGTSLPAVDDVSFRADEGQFVSLLGPSGCGKSTLLRIVAGLEQPDRGDVLIGGERVNDVPAAKRRVAMVFQNYALYPHLDVAENIVFGLKVRKVPAAERERRLARAVDMLGLREYMARRPAQLSGGQRQRVALGRAIVGESRIVLMDEPLSNLDAKLRQQMREELRGLQRELGLTVVYVTHDQVEAMTMSDRVVVMRRGAIEQVAAPVDLYRFPATTTVAAFVGSPPMNLVAARIEQGLAIATGAPALRMPVAGIAEGRDVVLGIRPEHLRTQGGGIAVRGTARLVEYLGADTIVGLDIGIPGKLVARLPGLVAVGIGEALDLRVDPAEASVFDAATGARVPQGEPR
jgi:ABC-type sugar transport system ATPase subunit